MWRPLGMLVSGLLNQLLGDVSDVGGYEFVIVSLDNRQWHFEASSPEVSGFSHTKQPHSSASFTCFPPSIMIA